jgi:hypothetical protein
MVVGLTAAAYSLRVRLLLLLTLAASSLACGQVTSEAQLADEASDLRVRRVDVYAIEYPEPEPELGRTGTTVDLPDVPGFPTLSKGPLRPKELLRVRRSLLGRRIVVRGLLSWRHDCIDQNYRPNVSRAELQRFIRANPDRCKPTQLAIADSLGNRAPTVLVVGGPTTLGLRRGAAVLAHGRWTERGPDGLTHPGGLLVLERLEADGR